MPRNDIYSNFKKILEILGKPLFYFVIFLASTLIILGELIKKLAHIGLALPGKALKNSSRQLKKAKKRISLVRVKLPRPSLRLPKISTPNLKLTLPKVSYKHIVLALILIFSSYSTFAWFKSLPSPRLLSQNRPSLSTKIYDRNGELLYKIYKDENRTLVKKDELPPDLINATISAEDKGFYKHLGLSPTGIVRAMRNNISGSTLQGGSTITQQLVKNALLTPEKTISRKLKEAVLALEVEYFYTKDQILEMYLNEVPYGGTAYGVEEAAQQYFGKSAKELDLAESALIAALPSAPSTLSPFGNNPYLAKIRQESVLETMYQEEYISLEQKEEAVRQELSFNPKSIEIKAPHFVMYVREALAKKYSDELITQGGLEITTTLDYETQTILQNEISSEVERLKNLSVGNGAGLVVNPQTGEILAMVGSKDYFNFEEDGQVNVTLRERQPGSSIKPITYALAFMNGYSPSTRVKDDPICFTVKGQPPYCPKNYDGRFHGEVTLRTALASSYNVPATKILNNLGVDNMISLGKSLGITTWTDPSRYGLSLTLGGGEVTMYDMAQVYSTFANGGKKVEISPVLEIKNHEGKIIEKKQEQKPIQVIPETVAFQINDILSDRSARAPAFGYNSILNSPPGQVAVKTGTTNSLRDNWTIGYTKDRLVAIWVGNNDNTPMSRVASGITGASPIWANTMDKLIDKSTLHAFNPPENLVRTFICPLTNTIYCKECPTQGKWEYYTEGSQPKYSCTKDQIGKILEEAAKDEKQETTQ